MRTFAALLILLSACSESVNEVPDTDDFFISQYEPETPDDVEPTESWSHHDRPTLFSRNLVKNVDELPEEGAAESTPWAGSYWPVYKDSINDKWDGPESMSPAAKYGQAFGIEDFEDLVSEHHGIDSQTERTPCESNDECNDDVSETCAKRDGEDAGYCIPKWWGICHAWAPIAILEPEPQQAVTVNDVEFKINDIKALATLAYNRTRSRFVGLRCNKDDSEEEIEYDLYDRPSVDNTECRDTNPGTYHILLANYLGLKGESFVEDRTFDNEVWNQPLRAYRVTLMDPIGVERAHELIGVPEDEEPTETVGGTYEFTANLDEGEWVHKGPYAVVDGASVEVEMSGENGDADLYVNFGETPNEDRATDFFSSAYDCRPYKPHSDEFCSLTAKSADTEVYVSVRGYSDAEVEVSVTVVDPSATNGDAVEYQFNDDATQFYHVKLEVDYLTESPSTLDGNLADRIDTYTRTDRYQYVLEVDDRNEIIGGEWVGTSKRNHPDFLWLPTSRSFWQKPADGKLKWDDVKDLIESSQLSE